MNTAALLDTVERLCSVELDTLDRDELADVVTASSRVRGWLDALDMRCARQGRSLADAGRAEPPTRRCSRAGIVWTTLWMEWP